MLFKRDEAEQRAQAWADSTAGASGARTLKSARRGQDAEQEARRSGAVARAEEWAAELSEALRAQRARTPPRIVPPAASGGGVGMLSLIFVASAACAGIFVAVGRAGAMRRAQQIRDGRLGVGEQLPRNVVLAYVEVWRGEIVTHCERLRKRVHAVMARGAAVTASSAMAETWERTSGVAAKMKNEATKVKKKKKKKKKHALSTNAFLLLQLEEAESAAAALTQAKTRGDDAASGAEEASPRVPSGTFWARAQREASRALASARSG